MKLELNEFEKAYKLLSDLIPATPLIKNDWLSSKYGANIYLKLENLQPVGSFKLRGATNKIFNLTDEEKAAFKEVSDTQVYPDIIEKYGQELISLAQKYN